MLGQLQNEYGQQKNVFMKNMMADSALDLTAFSQPKLGASILKNESSFNKNNSFWNQKTNFVTAQRNHLENVFQKNSMHNLDADLIVEETIIRMTENGKNLIEEAKQEAQLNKSPMKDKQHSSVRKNSVTKSGAKDSNSKFSSPSKEMCIEEPLQVNHRAPSSGNKNVAQPERNELKASMIDEKASEAILSNLEKINPENQNQKMRIEEEDPGAKKGIGPVELIIQPADGVQTNNFYCLNEAGGRIGRHSNNEIVILEESVSRHHSEIEFKEGNFYLIDIGSTTGTFIKIQTSLELQEGLILELGSNQFYIEEINCISEEEGEIKLKIIEGMYLNKEICVNNFTTIGRKCSSLSSIAFGDDPHLSNNHAKIEYIEGRFIFQDLGSTNG